MAIVTLFVHVKKLFVVAADIAYNLREGMEDSLPTVCLNEMIV